MDKMYEKNYYADYPITSHFAEDRTYMYKTGKYHEGIDYGSQKLTKTNIYNLINGLVYDYGYDSLYGYYVKIGHNPSFVGGADETFFFQYCHLEYIENFVQEKNFIKNGTLFAKMGNTGNSKGIHLHLMTFQFAEENKETKLLQDIIKITGCKHRVDNYFWQWGKIFYNPILIQDYFKILQG